MLFLVYDTFFLFRKNKTKRVTRVEMNRRARRKDRLRAEEEAKKKQSLSKEIDRLVYFHRSSNFKIVFAMSILHLYYCNFLCSLPNIIDEIAKEDKEKEKRRIRRNVTKEERLKSGPPRLGKHKYISKTS
jgi:nucleolar protein 53